MSNSIQEQLSKDVQEAGVLLLALPAGDELVGYQCTLIVRRSSGQLDAVHAAVSGDTDKEEVGTAIRERTAASWGG